ncbi:MCE family protein [Mycobacterium avium subsp. paratuberculosis]|uniref:MCE family protein n=1 Tax=Mycobacterium avium TaxID=1764 RepID=UPI000B8B223D|nr:MCE family protein [Mycobacterium avium]QQK50829.1 MCE family protein [Mycobacterium avium subsp. paratuberculosis]WAI53036.1 MCE family protein [Mycobacterium avium subsp. paratuberculosis]
MTRRIQAVPAGHRAPSHPLASRRPTFRYARPLAGLATVIAAAAVLALALTQFRGGFTQTVPVTVVAGRAGLMMNPGAKVKLHGAPVGSVASIQDRADGQADIHLALDPSRLQLIPANVLVNIVATTAFGAKFIQLIPPESPSPQRLRAGQVLDAGRVTVEINSVFQQLTSVLAKIDPAKLSETLGAMATALNGRGARLGQMFSDLNNFLGKIEPSLPNLSHDIEATAEVSSAYADAAPDLITVADRTTRISQTLVDEQQNLDALLISSIGLADLGNDVLGTNREKLAEVTHLLAPTTDLTNEYHQALTCSLKGMFPLALQPPTPVPGLEVLGGITLGSERYRFPKNLPKVAARGGPQCDHELPLAYNTFPPFDVADIGANPWQYGQQGILLNSDGLKQFLYGPLDGPPRNTAQIGQPG